jgi:GT2 family glycosyltransferase
MNRTSLDFLKSIFKYYRLQDLHILIINQTTKGNELYSENDDIRVINDYEKGLSRSRNLGIRNAIGEICLIADDDVEYLPDTIDTVRQAYKDYPDAAMISFQYLRENNKTFKKYKEKGGYQHHLLHKQVLTSMEITFNSKRINNKNVGFNTVFSFGGRFHWFEEQVFRDDIVRAGLKIAFVPKPIVKHYGKTSVPKEGSKKYTQGLVAQKYLVHKNLIYIWIVRYIWILLKRKSINISEIGKTWRYGTEAVRDYKDWSKRKK